MFWDSNFSENKATATALNEENVTLAKLLDADDLLHECRSQNLQLINFLCQPTVIAELISMITQEPDKSIELSAQYRNASLACEVLSSNIHELRNRLSNDIIQLGRLCDFLNQEPPLNPLLASYFSKTIEMLFQRGPTQDWCSYQIICLRFLDFFKSRKDFLPNLFRHIGTSAIMDTFKYFIQIDSLSDSILAWFEEYYFIDTLIQLVCGTYNYQDEKLLQEHDNKNIDSEENSNEVKEMVQDVVNGIEEAPESGDKVAPSENPLDLSQLYTPERLARRIASDRSHNATALICDLLCYELSSLDPKWPDTGFTLVRWFTSEKTVSYILTSIFTAPHTFRKDAILNGILIIFNMLKDADVKYNEDAQKCETAISQNRESVVRALALHLPLLHQLLLEPYNKEDTLVGPLRVQTAALISLLASVNSQEVSSALVALGTCGVLLDLFFKYEDNNFLHTAVYVAINQAMHNAFHCQLYCKHILIECDLLKRLADSWELNEQRRSNKEPRAGYMGRVIQLAEDLGRERSLSLYEIENVPKETIDCFHEFFKEKVLVQLEHASIPLGGSDPKEEEANEEDGINEKIDMAYEDFMIPMNTRAMDLALTKFSTTGFTGHEWDDEEDNDNGLLLNAGVSSPSTGVLENDTPWGDSGSAETEEGWANFSDSNAFWDYTQTIEGNLDGKDSDDPFKPINPFVQSDEIEEEDKEVSPNDNTIKHVSSHININIDKGDDNTVNDTEVEAKILVEKAIETATQLVAAMSSNDSTTTPSVAPEIHVTDYDADGKETR